MNGTECRPQAPVAEGGPAPYEGSLGDAPKTLCIFLATPYPQSEGGSEIVRVAGRGATGGTDGTGSPGVGGMRAASGRLKPDVKLSNAFV